MAWRWTVRDVVMGGMLLVGLALHAHGAAGQIAAVVQASPATYAIPLKDGNTAVIWWDAVSDPTNPGWRCEVPMSRGGGADRTIITLVAPAGDWRAALAEARAFLRSRVADSQ